MIFLFFMETAATWIYTDLHTLPLHDALPIWQGCIVLRGQQPLLAERRAQGVAEGARESRQGLAGIAVGVLDEQRAVGRVLPRHLGAIDRRFHLQRRLARRDPVLRVKPAQFREYQQLLPRDPPPSPPPGHTGRDSYRAKRAPQE